MNVKNRLSNLTMKNIHNNKLELKNKVELLNNLSPTNTMLRGYSIINKDDKVITSTQDLSKDDEITLAMKDGNVDAIVKRLGVNMSKDQQSFEEMMQELENIVQKLDNETVSLEESLELYQRGMKLSATCDATLKDAEKKVNQLIKDEERMKKMAKKSMNELINQINSALDGVIETSPLNTNLEESMQYSLNAGGKRIRPLLVFLTLDVLNQDYKKVKTALALEMIHTYSLIHDDLPAMDNDDYRRGKLTNHKVYGEWKAILAGDALLTKAFEIIADDELLESDVKVKILSRLAHNSGHLGMVGGQTLDMQSEDKPVDLDTLEQIHKAKTGALLQFAVLSAADIAKVDKSTSQALEDFSNHMGLMFQIKDDLLDVYGDESKLGKKLVVTSKITKVRMFLY